MTIQSALKQGEIFLKAHEIESSSLDSEVLLGDAAKHSREFLWAHSRDELPSHTYRHYRDLLERRAAHEPVAYITERKEFYGLQFTVNNHVLIPRPETELLIEEVRNWVNRTQPKNLVIADVGTGSGCIAVTLSKFIPQAEVFATDISEDALAVAKKNSLAHKVDEDVHLLHGNLLEPLLSKAHVIVSNLPYLNQDEMNSLPPDIKNFEPQSALDGGPDGLRYIRELLSQALLKLEENGLIAIEISPVEAVPMIDIVKTYFPQKKIFIRKDLAGLDRLVVIQ